ncbi:MAG: gliding motility-associated C-terminal domain-containing protein [Chitinophagaceae bacterium]|nr:gliding motility-associated C-terminal domain-containing protein [Chitinophagaceae bacterium]
MRMKIDLSVTSTGDKSFHNLFVLKNKKLFFRFVKSFLVVAVVLFFSNTVKAQFTATWGLTSTTLKTGVAGGTQATAITVADMVPGASFPIPGSHNTDGYRCQIASGNWPTVATDGYHIDFPLSANGSYDLDLTGLTFTVKTSGSSGANIAGLAYQADGAGAWTSFGTPQSLPSGGTNNINFGTLSTSLPAGHTYVIRMYIYAAGTTTSSRSVYIKNVLFIGTATPAGPAPTVLTTAAASTGTSSGSASGDITAAGAWPVTVSGFCWDLAANPTTALSTITTNGPLSGPFTTPITGLAAATTYHVRAYATSLVGTTYGTDLTFTTDPATLATLTTTAAVASSPVTGASGGNITDNGGVPVTQRGVCWNTTGTPSYPASSNTSDGSGIGSYSSFLAGLSPSTTYFVRAYAINAVGTAYGNEVSFTTPAATPTILVVPDSLGFGTVLQGTTSPNQTYTISGFFLSPVAGNITIVAPAGYQISTNSGSGFVTSLNLPYTGNTLAATTIYVHFSPASLANYNKNITNSGGGAPSQNVKVTGAIDPVGGQGQQGFSNKGKDFWVGYGATEKMTGDNSQDLRFTFNNPNSVPANITISIPNQSGFTALNYTVPANSILTTNNNDIPEGLTPGVDARLMNEGVFNSGIHIVSDQPIVAYAHNVTSAVYAATVLFPTPTLGREYISLNFTQRFNSSPSVNRSYCFAIATEDNTLLEVVLPVGVSTATHADGTTFTQLLNKGEILNLFGASTGSETAIDMSGVIVRSLSGTTGCKPFAFFCGSGKITIDCSTNTNVSGSGDNLFQQMFPKVAWGYKYITVPTQPAHMNINHFRVLVDNPAAVVKRNGVILSGLVNNSYYEYLNIENSVDVIEADKPVMVAQYMTTHGQCGNASASTGDPEMIYLSSVQQTIDTVSLVSSPLGGTNGRQHFINVTTKTSDAVDFRLDGVAVTFTAVTNDPVYSYAQIPVAESSHTLTSPRGFNAIAYGVANDESYGYNAGTNLVDLLSGFNVQNQYASGTSVTACRGSEFYMRVTLAFRATSIIWDFNSNPNLTPSGSITQTNPVAEDSVIINGVKLFIYKLATPFIYRALGSFDVKVTANNPTPDGCDGNKTFTFPVTVNQGPVADFTFSSTSGCLLPVQFTDASAGNGGTVNSWKWDFGDTTADSIQNPLHTYIAGGSFTVKLRAITAEGCYADTTKVLTFSGVPLAGFSANTNGCVNVAHTFTDTSKITSGTITQWNWDFGVPGSAVSATNGNAQTYTYTSPGVYTVTLTAVSSTGCSSVVFSQQITIAATPSVTLAALTAVCNTNPAFSLTGGSPATVSGVGAGVYSGPGVSGGNFDPAVAGVGTHTITYTYTTVAGCTAFATQTIGVSQSATLTISQVAPLCVNAAGVTLVPSLAGGVFTGTGVSGSSFSPAAAGVGTFTVGYSIASNACTVPASLQIIVNPVPTGFSAGSNVESVFGHVATLTGAGPATNTYLWTPATVANPTNLVTNSTAAAIGSYTYTLTATNNFGCTATDDVLLTISPICIDPPNVFTPNGDGFYDKWVVINGSCTKEVKVDVYNRWGGLVYSNNQYGNNWDGTSKGKTLPDGTYYYIIKANLINNGGQVFLRGNVTIMR